MNTLQNGHNRLIFAFFTFLVYLYYKPIKTVV
nr:MAG TPA: hypothetical protein [Caudoviricetes sp.]